MPSAALIIGLPEVLQARILELAGNFTASSLSLASQDFHVFLWQSMQVWQARLTFTVTTASIGQVVDFQREYRWKACGIDALCSPCKLAGHGGHALVRASYAVKALVAEDAPFGGIMATTLVDLVRSYDYADDFAHRAAEALVQDVFIRGHVFTVEHSSAISSAYDSACWMRETLLRQNSDLEASLEEHFTDGFPDLLDEPDDVPELVNRCDSEASIEDEMERLRSLPDSV
jgi:hypothetical protein